MKNINLKKKIKKKNYTNSCFLHKSCWQTNRKWKQPPWPEQHKESPQQTTKCSNGHFLQCRSVQRGCRLGRGSNRKPKTKTPLVWNASALSIPAPDRRVVTHGDQNAAVAAEARLPDGWCTFGEGQRDAPGEQRWETIIH